MTVVQLIDRGWTQRLIKMFLGKEDLRAWLGQGRATCLYKVSRILETESSNAAFQEELRLSQSRSKNAQQRGQLDQKKQRVLNLAAAMPLPELPLPFPEMLKRAWLANNGAATTSERVALDFLLVTMDSLGRSLQLYAGHPGVREAREKLKTRYLEHIRERYPLLSGEIDQMLSTQKEAQTTS
jgi:hypothetical protein